MKGQRKDKEGKKKGKAEKRKLSDDGEVSEASTTSVAKRAREDGGASVPAGYIAIYYEHADCTVDAHRLQAVKITPTHLANCGEMADVARVVRKLIGGLDHAKDLDLRFCKGEQTIFDYEDFLEQLRGSERTSPIQIFCPASPVVPVAETAVWKRNLVDRYNEFAPSLMIPRNVRQVQELEVSETGPLYRCGRPFSAAGLEGPLMHPAFGTFVQNLRDTSLATREDYAFVRDFCQKSSEWYKTEYERQTALASLLEPYLKRNVNPLKVKSSCVDGFIGRR